MARTGAGGVRAFRAHAQGGGGGAGDGPGPVVATTRGRAERASVVPAHVEVAARVLARAGLGDCGVLRVPDRDDAARRGGHRGRSSDARSRAAGATVSGEFFAGALFGAF